MARGIYSVSFDNVNIANASGDHDWFQFLPTVGKPLELCAVYLGQSTELGDAQEEQLRWSVVVFTGATLTEGNGTAGTEEPLDPNDGASSVVTETVATTIATSSGTTRTLHRDTFNVRTGLQMIWPVDLRPKCAALTAHDAMVVRMLSTVTDDITMSGTAYYKEL